MTIPRPQTNGHPSVRKRERLNPGAFVASLSYLMQPFRLESPKNNLFHLNAINAGSLSLVRIQSRYGFSIHTEPNPLPYKIDLPLSTGFQDARSGSIFLPQQWAYIPRQGEAVDLHLADENNGFDMLCVLLSPQALQSYALKVDPDREMVVLPEDQRICLSSVIGETFQRYVLFILQEFLTTRSLTPSAIVMQEFQTTLLAMVLELLPKAEGKSVLSCHGNALASRKIVNDAEEFIRAHLAEPLSIGRISSTLNVHSRTLHKAFRRQLDTTPMAYVKALRLESARAELMEADPACHTVTQVASKWGFNNPGHFSVYYRKNFGECPTDTLRRATSS